MQQEKQKEDKQKANKPSLDDDYYSVLGINDRKCMRHEVKFAFVRQAREFGQPKEDDEAGKKKWENIQKAFQVLYDPQTRLEYDYTLDPKPTFKSFKLPGAMMLQPSSGRHGFRLLPKKEHKNQELCKKMIQKEAELRLSKATQDWFDANPLQDRDTVEAYYFALQKRAVVECLLEDISETEQQEWVEAMRATAVRLPLDEQPFWVKWNRSHECKIRLLRCPNAIKVYNMDQQECTLQSLHHKNQMMCIIAASAS
jgi:curved DNA-binding protein CbpA